MINYKNKRQDITGENRLSSEYQLPPVAKLYTSNVSHLFCGFIRLRICMGQMQATTENSTIVVDYK